MDYIRHIPICGVKRFEDLLCCSICAARHNRLGLCSIFITVLFKLGIAVSVCAELCKTYLERVTEQMCRSLSVCLCKKSNAKRNSKTQVGRESCWFILFVFMEKSCVEIFKSFWLILVSLSKLPKLTL